MELVVKNPPANAGNIRDVDSIPGLGRSSGGVHDYSLQHCLENPMDRGAWWATVRRVAKSWTRLKWLDTWLNWISRITLTISMFIPLSHLQNHFYRARQYIQLLWVGHGHLWEDYSAKLRDAAAIQGRLPSCPTHVSINTITKGTFHWSKNRDNTRI